MEGRKYKRHKKYREAMGQTSASRPLYSKGKRTDDVDGLTEKPKGKAPMDPRYPPAKYVQPEDFAYPGPRVVLPTHTSIGIEQPHYNKSFWPNWYIWVILSAVLIGISITIVFVAFYVFGELTESSPVYKGYFG